MTTLTDFLLARIAEDEADARALSYNWNTAHEALRRRFVAECEAKRQIVTEHQPVDPDPGAWCERCVDRDTWPCPTMAALTLPYADHPDYNPEWRP